MPVIPDIRASEPEAEDTRGGPGVLPFPQQLQQAPEPQVQTRRSFRVSKLTAVLASDYVLPDFLS
jgi:hypothetical protein